MDITFLQKNYVLVILALLFSIFTTFIMNLIIKQKDEEKIYIKTGVSAVLISSIIVYIHTMIPPIEEIITSSVPF